MLLGETILSGVTMSNRFCPSRRAEWAKGQPISDLMSRALANPGLISLAAGFVDQGTLPVAATREALAELLSDTEAGQAALQYGTTPGDPALRQALLDRALADGHGDVSPTIDQVVITAGSNQLLHLLLETLLDPQDIVLCAAPTYLVFLGTVANVGARAVGVATDEQGMIAESLDEMLRALDERGELARVKAVYLVTYFDNPRGITMSGSRLADIMEVTRQWSREQAIYVIADEAYRDLRYDGESVPGALAWDREDQTVIPIGTFSKSFSPGIRVGWGILPKPLVEPVCNLKGNIDFGSPNFSQHLMHRVLTSGLFDRHVSRLRHVYREKRDIMLTALDRCFRTGGDVSWVHPDGGLYVWLTVPEGLDTGPDGPLFQRAIDRGVLYVPGRFCFPAEGEPVRENTIRLSFGVQSAEGIEAGVNALAEAIRDVP